MSTRKLSGAFVAALVVMIGLQGCVVDDAELDDLEQEVALPPPANLVVQVISTTGMTLTWNASPGATRYAVMRGLTPGSETAFTRLPSTQTTYTYNHLSPNTQYCWQIRNINVTNEVSGPSNEVCASTASAVLPAVPANVTATPVSSSRIQVSWTASAGASGYEVFAAVAPGAPVYVATVTSPSTTFPHNGLTPGTTYRYQVRALSSAGSSALSAVVSATTPTVPVPQNVVATAISSTRIVVTWNAVAGATSYQVFGAPVPGAPAFLGTVNAPTTTFTHANLTPSTTYSYEVRAVTANGVSAPSTPPAIATTFADGLELYLKLDEEAGTSALDSSGFNRSGTLSGGAVYSNDKPNVLDDRSTVRLPSGSTSVITVPYATTFTLGNPFTVTLWVKVPTAATDLHLVGMRNSSCGAIGWEIGQNAANGLYFAGETGGIRGFGTTLPVGEWAHVAATGDGTTLRLYVNGVQTASSAFTVGNHFALPVQVGHVGGCTGGEIFVDEVQILSRVMSPAQIAAIGDIPDAPINLVITGQTSTRMDIAWTQVPTAAKYIIYRGTAPGNATFLTSTSAADSEYSYGHLTPNTQYVWQVAVAVGQLFSFRSNEALGSTLPPPAPPAGVIATPTSTSRIRVDWQAVPGAVAYRVYQSTGGGAFVFRGTTTNLTFTAAGLASMTSYSYQVRTVDSGNTQSAPSATATATTL